MEKKNFLVLTNEQKQMSMNGYKRTNVNEHITERSRTRHLFVFVNLANRTKFLVCVRSFIKRTNTNELPAERFTNRLPNVWFVYSPTCTWLAHVVSNKTV